MTDHAGTLRGFHEEAIVIDEYEDVDAILKSPDVVQDEHHPHERFLRGTLLMLDGEPHTERRRLETPLFRRSTLALGETDVLDPAIRQAFEWWQNGSGSGEEVRGDLVLFVRVILHRIAAATVGLDVGVTLEESLDFIRCLEDMTQGVEVGFDSRDRATVVARADEAVTTFRMRYLEPSLARRRNANANADAPPDLLKLWLSSDQARDEALLLREAVLYVLAATVTTTRTVPHLFHHLDSWWRKHPADRARATDAGFLRAAAAESLRLHPTTPAVHRRASSEISTPSGIQVPAGSLMLVSFRKANRDPRLFGADTDRFDPHRVVPSGQAPYGLAFGAGAHVCIGRNLAIGTDGAGSPQGAVVRIVQALSGVGAAPDQDRIPTVDSDRMYDEFATYPIVWRAT